MDVNIQKPGLSQEGSFDMGDEASLAVSVAADPYEPHSYGI